MRLSDSEATTVLARTVDRSFALQNDVIAAISPRLAQRIRCNRLVGHFHKWYLGDGAACPWCWLCRSIPAAKLIIPYIYHDRLRDE